METDTPVQEPRPSDRIRPETINWNKEKCVSAYLDSYDENRRLMHEVDQLQRKQAALVQYFNRIVDTVTYFLDSMLPNKLARSCRIIAYLYWLWNKCSREETQGFCFSPAHERFIKSVERTLNGDTGFVDSEAEEEVNQRAAETIKNLTDSMKDNVQTCNDRVKEILNAES